jgi:hypothetical protein
VVAAGVIFAAASASAQPDLREEAQRHFAQGVAFFESRDFEGALSEFQAAQLAHPHPRFLRNIAGALEALRRYVDAIQTLERFVAEPIVTAAERRQAEVQLRGLRNLLARLEIVAEPIGAEVLVDGRLVGTAPLAEPVTVASGQVHLVVRRVGHRTVERDVRVAAGTGGREEIVLVPLRARLHLDSNAAGARAAVGEAPPEHLPLDRELPPGTYVVRTEAPGFVPDTSRVVLSPDEDRTLTIVLDRPPATLRLDVGPAAARVLVDGEPSAEAGRGNLLLPGGSHRMRVEGPGLVPWEDDVVLVDGGRHALRARLGRDRLWVRPGWFWGGAVTTGGGAAAAIVTGIRVLLLHQEINGVGRNDVDKGDLRGLLEEEETMLNVTYTLWVGSAAAGVGTFVLYLLSRGEPPDPQVRVR